MEGIHLVEALSFDVYGTLIDWETGIASALRPWANRHGLLISDDALVSAFARHETRIQTEHPTWRYPEILSELMWRIGNDLDAPVTELEAAAFGRSVGQWPAFADSAESLRRLKQRFKLIVLSNVDNVSLRLSNDRLGVEFDAIVTAEEVGAYKPSPSMFDSLDDTVEALGYDTNQVLHVAESLYHDHEPAKARGMQTAWIHRRHAKDGYGATAAPGSHVVPDHRFESLALFTDAILAAR
ncbi:MAG: HAD-IA family hydrolase [Acidimicrobiales bacterium]